MSKFFGDKSQDKNGHRRYFPTLAGMFAYLDKQVKGAFRPKVLYDHPRQHIKGKRKLRHS